MEIGTRFNSFSARDAATVLHPFTDAEANQSEGSFVLSRGEGVYVFDEEGKAYLESMAGLWCVSLGFSEKRLSAAAFDQMNRLPFAHSFFQRSNEPQIALAEKLLSIAPVPMSKVFFTSSGSEAIDTAIKLIWYRNNAIGRPQKKKIIGRKNAYHGSTIAASSIGGIDHNHVGFDVPHRGFLHTECPHHYRNARPGESEEAYAARLADNLDALICAEGPETIAAFFAEPIIGAGGVLLPPRTYFDKVQDVLRKHDILFVVDEIICGFGRTGNMWGSDTYALKPDILTCGKALSSGYQPISAIMLTENVYRPVAEQSHKLGALFHGFTFGGHPVAAAVALETLKIYEDIDLISQVRSIAPALRDGIEEFAEHPLVGEVASVGALSVIELVSDKATKAPFSPQQGVGRYLIARAREHGLIMRAIGNRIGFSPPLIISESEIGEMYRRFGMALDETHAWLAD